MDAYYWNKRLNPFWLNTVRQLYKSGGNITEFLREEFDESSNSSEIIEIAYDLQAGTYLEEYTKTSKGKELRDSYAEEIYSHLSPHLTPKCSLMDVGTGELLTLTLIAKNLDIQIEIFAFDISWSRLYKGRKFWNQNITNQNLNLSTFVADMKKIPFSSKSIDITTSMHALEPNGKNLESLLKELFRVTRSKCVLFEPSYKHNSDEGKKRMDRLGYIKDIEETVENLGGTIIDVIPIKKILNPLNPTACFVIEPPRRDIPKMHNGDRLSVPGTDFPLTLDGEFLTSADTGYVFPILKEIPILKDDAAILATSLFE